MPSLYRRKYQTAEDRMSQAFLWVLGAVAVVALLLGSTFGYLVYRLLSWLL